VREFRGLMRQLIIQTNTISEYSACNQRYYEDCRFAQRINNRNTDCFISQAKRTAATTINRVCMFTLSCSQTERRASQVSFCREELFSYERRSKYDKGARARSQEDTRGSCGFTATLLVLLILLTREVATLACHVQERSARAIGVVVVVVVVVVVGVGGGSFHSVSLPPSLPFTRMVTRAAWFSLCIFPFVPYLLTSLHVTTSTAIKAVDDNQSAN